MGGSPYADLSRPPLRAAALRQALVRPAGFLSSLQVVAETGSTNADVAELARSGVAHGLCLVAEAQTAGRGRLDRQWRSPARAGLTFSLLLRPGPHVPVRRWGWLALLTGVALVEAVGRLAGLDSAVKWPNDLLVRAPGAAGNGGWGKCGGVLAEIVDDPGSGSSAVVVGIGINVSQRADELPEAPDLPGASDLPEAGPRAFPPTSLALAGAVCTDRDPLLRAVLRACDGWYDRWQAADGDPQQCGLRTAYQACCVTLGHDVAVGRPGGSAVRGEAIDIDADGRLVVSTTEGLHSIAAGDVVHVR